MADSSKSAPARLVSILGNFNDVTMSVVEAPELSPFGEDSSWAVDCLFSEAEAAGSVFFSLSFCSNPSTLFRRASKTSVFGPLFFGTASVTEQHRTLISKAAGWVTWYPNTYRIYKGIGRPDMPRTMVADGCT